MYLILMRVYHHVFLAQIRSGRAKGIALPHIHIHSCGLVGIGMAGWLSMDCCM
jgi:hypothetical protein